MTYRQLRERPRERPFGIGEPRLRFHSDKDQSCRDQRISEVILPQLIGFSAKEILGKPSIKNVVLTTILNAS